MIHDIVFGLVMGGIVLVVVLWVDEFLYFGIKEKK